MIRYYPDGRVIPPTNVLIRELDFGWGIWQAVTDCIDQLVSIAWQRGGFNF